MVERGQPPDDRQEDLLDQVVHVGLGHRLPAQATDDQRAIELAEVLPGPRVAVAGPKQQSLSRRVHRSLHPRERRPAIPGSGRPPSPALVGSIIADFVGSCKVRPRHPDLLLSPTARPRRPASRLDHRPTNTRLKEPAMSTAPTGCPGLVTDPAAETRPRASATRGPPLAGRGRRSSRRWRHAS